MKALLLTLGIACALVAARAQDDTVAANTAVVRIGFHQSDFLNYHLRITSDIRRHFPTSDLPSSYRRTWDIYFTQRIDKIGEDGIMDIETNVDSMRLHVNKGGVDFHFDSQDFTALQSVNGRDPELIGSWLILNKPFTVRMSLEGDVIDLHGWEQWTNMIDSGITDSVDRIMMKEYLTGPFMREVVDVGGGFTFGRTYANEQHWTQAMPGFVHVFPIVDSAALRIEVPKTKGRFVVTGEGTVHATAQAVRDRGFIDWSRVDSLGGTARDTIVIGKYGQVEYRVRQIDCTAALTHPQYAYSDIVKEEWVLNLTEYERR